MLTTSSRVVMVSGASRGLGAVITERLLKAGFTLSAGARDPAALPQLAGLMAHAYDAKEPGSGEKWVEATLARFGRVDALINCAGINPRVRVLDEGEADLDEMWQVNVKGPLRLSRAALPALMKSCLLYTSDAADEQCMV